MKKIFAMALAALALVACKPEGNNTPTDEPSGLSLDKKQLELKVGETAKLTANVAVDAWESSNVAVATVKDGTVTAVAAGSAIITAKAGSQSAKCMVKVTSAAGPGTQNGVKGSKVWAIIMDEVSFEGCGARIAGDARVDDVENFLYIWPDGTTYAAGDGVGMNAMGNAEGYVALTCTSQALGWSGLGFCISKEESVAALEALRQEILAAPDKYFFHFAMKSTDKASHKLYVFNEGLNGWTVGSTEIDGGAIFTDFTRDGKWHEIDVPMSKFTAGLQTPVKAGDNIFCALSGNQPGAQLNLDAVYFYKVEE